MAAGPAIQTFWDQRALQLFEVDLQRLLAGFSKRGGFREPLLQSSEKVLTPSIRKNFLVGGRPDKWKPSEPTSVYRLNRGSSFINAPPLMVTQQLFRAAGAKARWRVSANTLTYGYFPNKTWFAIVHDDPRIAERAEITARPFALIQPEDIKDMGEVFMRWVEKKVNQKIRLHYP